MAFLLNGFAQYRCVNGAHEAVHKNLIQPVWLNEFVGTVCAALAGVSTGLEYSHEAMIVTQLASYIRNLGYEAVASMRTAEVLMRW